jgi:hypothetical protein
VVGIDERYWRSNSPVTLRRGRRPRANNPFLVVVVAVVENGADVPEHTVAVVAQHQGDRNAYCRRESHILMFLTLEGAHTLTVDGDARTEKSQEAVAAAAAAEMACSRWASDRADQATEQAPDTDASGPLRTNWKR